MTAPTPLDSALSTPPGAEAMPARRAAPFLVWPVARREFYHAIWVAMIPSLTWGLIVFGVRALAMLVGSLVAATVSHTLLQRWHFPAEAGAAGNGDRALASSLHGKSLLYAHCLLSTFVLVALAHPLWPVWPVVCMALLLPVVLAIVGGPGHERTHVAVVLVLGLQFGIIPLLAHFHTYVGGDGVPALASAVETGEMGEGPGRGTGNAIMARDRLLMGDIRDHRARAMPAPLLENWPVSRELGGNDAVALEQPAVVAADCLEQVSRKLESEGPPVAGEMPARDQAAFRGILNRALALRLPGMDMQMLGAVPGRIGVVSLGGVVLAGLYLAYRTILRPHSVVLFVMAFVVGTVVCAFGFSAITSAGLMGVWNLLRLFPGEIATLLMFLLLNSDAGFAAVFILALPGTEPLSDRGRRIFLVLAGVSAAALHRAEPALPAATLCLCTLMPLARLFDWLFARRSWLHAT